MNLDFTLVDVLVILAVLVSAGYAAYRGFVNETLSIVAWAAAAFATLYCAPALAPVLRARISTPLVGTVLAYVGIFLVVLIPLSFIAYRFSENVKSSPVGVLDRSLGLVFGIVRGLVVVAMAYIVFTLFVPVRDDPHWIRDARLMPVIRSTSEILLSLVPDQHFGGSHPAAPATAPATAQQGVPSPKPKPQEHEVRKDTPAKHPRKAYGADDRRALDRLIEATGGGKP